MNRYFFRFVLLTTAIGFLALAAGQSSAQKSNCLAVSKTKSTALELGLEGARVLAEGVFSSEKPTGKIPAGTTPEKRLQARKKDGTSPLLFSPQPETMACDDGVLAGVDYNGVEEWNEAVRLTPPGSCSLTALIYWSSDPDLEYPRLTWGVWDDDGPGGLPSTLLDSGTVRPIYDNWFRVDLDSSIFIPLGEDIYIGWLDLHGAPYYVNGLDFFLDSCNYWFDGLEWQFDPWFDGDFMIRGICGYVTGVAEELSPGGRGPRTPALLQNRPNPFFGQTMIRYEIPTRRDVSLRIYDVSGRLVRTLVDKEEEAGIRIARWDARDETGSPVPSGVYLYRLKAGEFISTRKLVLLR
ncbi:T9SS type A sorting domain-containing protein [candidate division TA06 bacterium]|uniref:T9SS type A sorting domain-containing protein n=1 Tax=candidate division TA06 bacterium TaxID=2250710 RepID=A0A523URI4_UNCT6|nr:MAG: T9SS type A sorting domain-containing protein [candidate division TA06 bacterium]